MSEWQPIETAPTDGVSSVLLAYAGSARRVREGFYRKSREHWGYYGSTSLKSEALVQPTHWMPLPTPPQN